MRGSDILGGLGETAAFVASVALLPVSIPATAVYYSYKGTRYLMKQFGARKNEGALGWCKEKAKSHLSAKGSAVPASSVGRVGMTPQGPAP